MNAVKKAFCVSCKARADGDATVNAVPTVQVDQEPTCLECLFNDGEIKEPVAELIVANLIKMAHMMQLMLQAPSAEGGGDAPDASPSSPSSESLSSSADATPAEG